MKYNEYSIVFCINLTLASTRLVTDKRTDVVTVLDAAVGCVAVVHATTLADLLIILPQFGIRNSF